MSISSMTGFARGDGSTEGLNWVWEARSVNGRGLDVRLRVPPGFDAVEAAARDILSKRVSRGIPAIERAKVRAAGNTHPGLLTAQLLYELTGVA